MRDTPRIAALTVAGLLLAPAVAQAHKMEIEAKTDGTAVRVVAGYEGDEPAEGAKVTLTDAAGAVAAEGTTDAKGLCVLPRPKAGTYQLAVDDGAGHRAEVALPVPESEVEVTARTQRRNRWLMAAVGLAAIAGGTAVARLLPKRSKLTSGPRPSRSRPMPRRSPRGKPYHKPKPRDPNAPPPRKHGERSTAPGEHRPVMLAEVLAALDPRPGHVVVDCTLGFAGHSAELLKRVGPTGKLIATDLDPANLPPAEAKLAAVGFPFALRHVNFAGLPGVLAAEGVAGVDGLLADLGMSSMQVDDPGRGFSFLRDGPLDMRMDPTRGTTAAELLNALPQDELAAALRDLGDEPQAEAIAAAVVARRKAQPLQRTGELRELIEKAAPVRVIRGPGAPPERKQKLLPATRVFQALRVLVNRELASLSHLLRVLPDLLNPGGTAAVISFHSGEDRLVKAAFRDGLRADIYEAASDDPVRPTEEEKRVNPRSRSAKLRWARRKRY